MNLRFAAAADVDRLAQLWYEGWQDAHAEIVPAELKAVRTLDRFRERLTVALADVRVLDGDGELAGFNWLRADELYQLYVARQARGTGAARALIADAEARCPVVAVNGVSTAWLSCAIGNQRAARFYEKCGWSRVGTMVDRLNVPSGTFELETWRYEKSLQP